MANKKVSELTIGVPADSDLMYASQGGVDVAIQRDSIKSWLNGISPTPSLITDGTFHIASGSAGTVAANEAADELVIEGNTGVGMSFLSDATSVQRIAYGDPGSNLKAQIFYNHNADVWSVFTDSDDQLSIYAATGTVFNEGGVASLDFRVESDLNPHMFFVDAGNNSVHIDNSLTTGAGDGDLVMANNKAIRFVNNAGTTSANFGIIGGSGDDLLLAVPATTDTTTFQFAGSSLGWIRSENGGMGITFGAESSADHSAPSANRAVIYTKDNGAGKTQLAVRFNTGAVQILATEP